MADALLPEPTTHATLYVGPALHAPSMALKLQKPPEVVALHRLLNVETSVAVPRYWKQLVGVKVIAPTRICSSM